MSQDEINNFDLTSVGIDSDYGYMVECDLSYPAHLHKSHSRLPLACERVIVTEDMLSEAEKKLAEKLGVNTKSKVPKLVSNLNDKSHYITHYRNLQLFVRLGLVVTKVHAIVRFHQCRWLKPYIDYNCNMRRDATTTVEKANFKFMNNSVFGRFLLNKFKQIDLCLVTDEGAAKKLVSKPTFKAFHIINEDLCAIEMMKDKIFWNVCSYVGASTLEISKFHMYSFFYDHIVPYFGDTCQKHMMDTDSLLLSFTNKDPDQFERDNLSLFDTSDYPRNHPNYSEANKKTAGKFKDDFDGKVLIEFVGLRAKMYSIKVQDGKDKQRAKGVKNSYVEDNQKHEAYVKCLLEQTKEQGEYSLIRSKDHQLSTKLLCKDTLNSYDDKRHFLANCIGTVAHGFKGDLENCL